MSDRARRGATWRVSARVQFVVLVIANTLSLAGSGISLVAIPYYVLESTGDIVQTTIVGVINTIPIVIAGVFGGVAVDRAGYRRASIVCDFAAGGAVLAIALLEAGPGLSLIPLLVLVFARSLADTPGMNARESLLPELSERAGIRLEDANAAYEAAPRVALLVGPAAAAGILSAFGAVAAFAVDAGTFLISALLIVVFIEDHARANAADHSASGYRTELREGVRLVTSDRVLRALLVTVLFTNFLDDPLAAIVFPVYADEWLGNTALVGLLIAAFGSGAILGTLAFGWLTARISMTRRRLFVSAFGGIAVTRIGLVFASSLPAALVLLFVSGLASGPLNPLLNTVIQERTEPGRRARVMGVVTATAFAAAPLGVLAAGIAIERAGVRVTMAGIAALYVVAVLCAASSSSLRGMDHPPKRVSSQPSRSTLWA